MARRFSSVESRFQTRVMAWWVLIAAKRPSFRSSAASSKRKSVTVCQCRGLLAEIMRHRPMRDVVSVRQSELEFLATEETVVDVPLRDENQLLVSTVLDISLASRTSARLLPLPPGA